MPIGEVCQRKVVIAEFKDSVLYAAQLMRKHHVGDVVVVNKSNGNIFPVGIITDRDLAIEVLAPKLDPNTLTVADIMGSELATIKGDIGVFETIRYMRIKGVRHMPIVDGSGNLIGVTTLDDLFALLADELGLLAKLISHEQKKEAIERA